MAVLVGASAVAGAIYSIARTPPAENWLISARNGGMIGAIISSCVIGFELFGAPRLLVRAGRQLPLAAALLARTVLFGTVIVATLLIVPWFLAGVRPSPFRSGLIADVTFAAAATFTFVSLMSMVQLIGPNVLGSLLTGRYYRPREVERIVLFLDLIGSTGIAERIGPVRFHALLSETFSRLSQVVTDHGGEVYRYVGDALIATWTLGSPEQNARPIRCLFVCRDALAAARSDLVARHGELPEFRASLHAGPLVAGEIGGFKREIALLGDAMNTAARLEQECRTAGHAFLASKPLIDRAAMPPGVVATSMGSHLLRGKSERLEFFALERAARPFDQSHDS
jgi:adenylate cyclase